jgi:hypothetical protein
MPQELADPLGAFEIGETEDMEELGASGRWECFEARPEPASISSKVMSQP